MNFTYSIRKKIVLVICIIFICGCQNVNDLEINEITSLINENISKANVYRVGFEYNLPRGMQVDSNTLYNDVISNDKYDFYLFLDLVSYNAKKELVYQEVDDVFYSEKISKDDKFGYLEINLLKNDKYLIEIMYNYAKIEVMVEYKDINESLLYSINVLESIKYNDIVVENLIDDELLNFNEEEYNIFNTTSSDSVYLNYDDTYVPPTEEEYDQDLLN